MQEGVASSQHPTPSCAPGIKNDVVYDLAFFLSLSVKNTLTKELDRGDEVIMSFLSNFGAIKLHFCVGYVICHYNENKYRFGKIHCCFVPTISHSLYNFPISTLIRLLVDSVRWLVRLLIDWSGFRWVGHNFLKGLVVTLPCSYRSTCFFRGHLGSPSPSLPSR